MNWDTVKNALVTIAPWLSASLGCPIPGPAIQAICQVFGLTPDATPQQVEQAITNATPDQLLALKAADNKHAETMQALGYSHAEKIEQIAADDRNSARVREAAVKDHTPTILAAVAVGGFFLLVFMVSRGFAPADAMRDAFMMLSGAAIAMAKDVYGYYFGSSAGSRENQAALRDVAQGGQK